jgi:hypothetical protein
VTQRIWNDQGLLVATCYQEGIVTITTDGHGKTEFGQAFEKGKGKEKL